MDALNSRKMYNRSYSRRVRFLEVEKDRLHTLPATRFISKNRKTTTVMRNSYVSLNNHYYSVPKAYISNSTVSLIYALGTLWRYIIKDEQNIFITGSPGTGKSYLTSAIGYEAYEMESRRCIPMRQSLWNILKWPKIRVL